MSGAHRTVLLSDNTLDVLYPRMYVDIAPCAGCGVRGAVRCGAVRCGAVRCGAVRCGMVTCMTYMLHRVYMICKQNVRTGSICILRLTRERRLRTRICYNASLRTACAKVLGPVGRLALCAVRSHVREAGVPPIGGSEITARDRTWCTVHAASLCESMQQPCDADNIGQLTSIDSWLPLFQQRLSTFIEPVTDAMQHW